MSTELSPNPSSIVRFATTKISQEADITNDYLERSNTTGHHSSSAFSRKNKSVFLNNRYNSTLTAEKEAALPKITSNLMGKQESKMSTGELLRVNSNDRDVC